MTMISKMILRMVKMDGVKKISIIMIEGEAADVEEEEEVIEIIIQEEEEAEISIMMIQKRITIMMML